MKSLIKRVVVCILFFYLAAFPYNSIYSQFNNTIFWMQDLPQSAYSNIALQPSHGLYFGIPGLSSFYTSINHTGFALNDVVSKDLNNNLFIDSEKLLSVINERNNVTFDMQYEYLSFGLTTRDIDTFSFSIIEKAGINFGYSADFIRLLNYGNKHFRDLDRAVDFSGTSLDIIHYREFAFGYTRQITDYLVAGMRAKLLFGLANFLTEYNEISFYTDPNSQEIIAYADLMAHSSAPVSMTSSDDNNFSVNKYLLNTRNRGYAFDFGLAYKPIDNAIISLSIKDIGGIHWKDGVENISMKGEFNFDGFNINELIDEDHETDFLDLLKQDLNYIETFKSYRSSLTTGLSFSAFYQITPIHAVSILSASRFYNYRTLRTVSSSYQFQASEKVCLVATYSVIHGNFRNLGMGTSLNMNSIQFFLLSDNILGVMWPSSSQSVNIHFGFNYIIGYQRRSQLLKPHFDVNQIFGRTKQETE